MKFTYPNDARPVDGFTIRRGIHRGGFGEVYYAVSDAGKEVALKLLTHDLDTELRGIRQCLNLKHPNLVTIFDVKTDHEGDQWVVMEYVNGSNLEEVLTAFPHGLPLSEITDWMQGLTAGVEYLHDRGLIHRDLKPANIYRESGVVKIGDVGLSKRFDGDRRHQHTESIGTVYYMAPEITHGKYGPAVDIYSLGIILYEMLTGRLPFNGETSGEILMKQLSSAADLSIVPSNLKPVLRHALEKDPHKRTQSVRQLWTEYEQAIGNAPPTAIPDSHFVNGQRSRRMESVRKDTDRTGDTGKTTAPRPGLAYEAGRLWGAVVHDPPRTARNPDSKPKPYAARNYWGARLVLIVACINLIALPWNDMRGDVRLAAVIGVATWSGLLYALLWAREYWRSDNEPYWRPSLFGAFSRRKSPAPAPGSSAGAAGPSAAEPARAEPRSSDWSGSYAVGGMAGVLFALAGQLVVANFSQYHILDRPEAMVFFTAVTILGTWAAIACRWLTVKLPWATGHRRLLYAGAGLAVATAAAALDDYLLIDIGPSRLWGKAAFQFLGANPLLNESHTEPIWLGYVVFFCGIFALLGKRFDKLQDPLRKRRWAFRHLVVAALACIVWTHLFVFPQLLGLLWATTIVAAAQIASPWQPSVSTRTRC